MTKLKIKEKTKQAKEVEITADHLNDGDMLYSYNVDTLLLVVEQDGDLKLIDITDARLVDNSVDDFEHMFKSYNDSYGPFYVVDKAKITFTVGD